MLQAGVRPTLLMRDPTKLDIVTRERGEVGRVVPGDKIAWNNETLGSSITRALGGEPRGFFRKHWSDRFVEVLLTPCPAHPVWRP